MDTVPVIATGAVVGLLILANVFRRGFDPFAPVWLFALGFAQVYVLQSFTYRDWALRTHGDELVTSANVRALWALLWFLAVYYSGAGRRLSARLPQPPGHWSVPTVGVLAPVLIVWGLMCAGMAFRVTDREQTAEEGLLRALPFVMQLAGVMLLVTGRQPGQPRTAWTAAGVAVSCAYVLIWMFNGKRSHALFGVLTGVCAYYLPRYRRPSKPMLAAVGLACVVAVALAIGWRGNGQYERSFAGFFEFVGDFELEKLLTNTKLTNEDPEEFASSMPISHETEELGGFLLMMATVPEKAGYDYGLPYMRLWSTFIPRIVWPDKPLFGRDKWKAAWIAGSQMPRDEHFTGPAIGILGAAQLNGGAVGTVILLAVLAALLRTSYEYFRLHAGNVWVQCWWAATYYNAWLMVVNDDPFVWFYYNYGFTTFLPLGALWVWLKLIGSGVGVRGGAARPAAAAWS